MRCSKFVMRRGMVVFCAAHVGVKRPHGAGGGSAAPRRRRAGREPRRPAGCSRAPLHRAHPHAHARASLSAFGALRSARRSTQRGRARPPPAMSDVSSWCMQAGQGPAVRARGGVSCGRGRARRLRGSEAGDRRAARCPPRHPPAARPHALPAPLLPLCWVHYITGGISFTKE